MCCPTLLICLHNWLIVNFASFLSRTVHLYRNVTIAEEWLQTWHYCRVHSFEQGGWILFPRTHSKERPFKSSVETNKAFLGIISTPISMKSSTCIWLTLIECNTCLSDQLNSMRVAKIYQFDIILLILSSIDTCYTAACYKNGI